MSRLKKLQDKFEQLEEASRLRALELHANPATTQDDWDAFTAPAWKEMKMVEDEIMRVKSHQLARTANRLGVPLPEADKQSWAYSVFGNFGTHLTLEAQAKVRQAIRQERKDRREMWIAIVKDVVVPVGGIVISILSLMIAYAALHLKHT